MVPMALRKVKMRKITLEVMNKLDDAANFELSTFLGDPLAQGTVVGLLTLIPVRNYPRWLRRSIIWGPIVITSVGGVCLGAKPQMAEQLKQAEPAERSEHASEPEPVGGLRGAARALVPGLAIGAVMSGSMAVAIWADEKIDRGLHRIGIPFPRSVMGVAAGAITWMSVTQENQRDASQEAARQ